MTNEYYSCGGILFCYENGVRKYVLIMEANGNYGFPKGRKENNETDIETAMREVLEETGITIEFLPNLKRTIQYNLVTKVHKTVVFFIGKFENQPLIPRDKNILSAQKYDLFTAMSLLKFAELQNILLEVDYILDSIGE